MGNGVNTVTLLGNLGREPDMRRTAGDKPVTKIAVATSDSWKDKTSGQAKERTEWHQVIFFDRLAEVANEYLHKGSKVYIEGQLRTRKWKDKTTGEDKYTTEIIARRLEMLDSKGQGAGAPSSADPARREPVQQPLPAADGFDDDIPF